MAGNVLIFLDLFLSEVYKTMKVASPVVSELVVNSIQIINNFGCRNHRNFGIVTNVINIRIFRKLGYQDGVNITLTALAISDIGALVFLEIYIILLNPWIQETDLFILKSHLLYLVVYCRQYFIRASCLITSFAAFERCICVVLPLRVKTSSQ
ncbi:hypothetical protein Btru_071479 [Bulinus truncatus]|nr:hypothetical protein Btru_071479 [Bulinus truncatus]